MPKFAGLTYYSLEDTAKDLGISGERLKELADRKAIPHARIMDGPPIFNRAETRNYVKDHYIERVTPVPDPPPLVMVRYVSPTDGAPDYEDIPPELVAEKAYLKQYNHALYGPCVYFLCRRRKVVYVGQSRNLPGRIEKHSTGKQFDTVLYRPVREKEMDWVERLWQVLLTPEYNREPWTVQARNDAVYRAAEIDRLQTYSPSGVTN
jgi:hypothetical protein